MKILVNTSQTQYPIYLQRGAINSLTEYIDINQTIVILTDDGVPPAYLKNIQRQCPASICICVPQGEAAKSFECYQSVVEQMLGHNIKRNDLLMAVGGGVIGDLGGFVAATYLRGIKFVNIPTTSLAQIDSSIGGKVAINVAKTKNILGAFYPPSCVIIDLNTLDTLPIRHYNNGLAEALKAGIIGDPDLFCLFEQEDVASAIDNIVYRALLVKKRIVEEDEFEQGSRKSLNFGHTIGHAVESYFGLQGYLHGECVAYGMFRMIKDQNIKRRLENIYNRLSLPTSIPYQEKDVYPFIINDKKTHKDKITIVLVEEIGHAFLKDVPTEEIKAFFEATL